MVRKGYIVRKTCPMLFGCSSFLCLACVSSGPETFVFGAERGPKSEPGRVENQRQGTYNFSTVVWFW